MKPISGRPRANDEPGRPEAPGRGEGTRRKQRGSSHVCLFKEGSPNILTVPVHKGKDLKAGLVAVLIKKAGLSVDEFIKLYKG